MWNGSNQQDGERYTILPAGYNTELAPGASVSVGFLAEGEEEDLSLIVADTFFQEHNVLITTEEERQEEWYQNAKEALGTMPVPPTPEIPVNTPEVTQSIVPEETLRPTGTPEPEQTLLPTPTEESTAPPVSASAIPEETIRPTGTPEPEGTVEPVPTETPEPAEDLYIYADTMLTEDIVCGNLIIMAGTLNCNGYTVTVQKNVSMAGGSCTLQGGNLDVAGNCEIPVGSLEIGDGTAKIGGNLRQGGNGSIWMTEARGTLEVKGDMEIASKVSSRYWGGSLLLGGDLVRRENAGTESFLLENGFPLVMNGEQEQHVRDASPETSYYGNMDLCGSVGVLFGQKVRGGNMTGLSQIHNRDRLELEIDSLVLERDEELACETIILSKGSYRLGGNTWKINGSLQIGEEAETRLDCGSGRLQVTEDASIKNGALYVEMGTAKIGGNLRQGGNGSIWMTGARGTLEVKGDMEIASKVSSRYWGGSLLLGGDLTQDEEAAQESFVPVNPFRLCFNGQREQECDLAYPESTNQGILDIRESVGVYFPDPVYGDTFYGLEKVANEDEFVTYCAWNETSADGVINCDLVNYSYVLVNRDTHLTIAGDVYQNGMVDSAGGLTVTGDYFIEESSLYHGSDSTIKIKGDLWVDPKGGIQLSGSFGCLEVEGDFDTASRNADANYFLGGDLRIRGNVTRLKTACVESLSLTGTRLVPCGTGRQTIDLNAGEEDIYLASIDMTEAEEVFFQDGRLYTGAVHGWDKIKNDELILQNSRIRLDQDERYHGSLTLIQSTWDCYTHNFCADGAFELTDSECTLFSGGLEVGENFTLAGVSRLIMQSDGDTLCVHGDFETSSTESHSGLLTCGRFELYGNFTQSGHEESFLTDSLFVMAFCAEGIQDTHFDSTTCYWFANVDPAYAGYRTVDSVEVAAQHMLKSIGMGVLGALEELILSPDELVAAAAVAVLDACTHGIMGKAMCALMIGCTAMELYDTVDKPINRYERIERYAGDATTLFITVFAEQFLKTTTEKLAEKAVEKFNDETFIRRFIDFVMDKDLSAGISDRLELARIYFAETDAEVFSRVAKYLDADALEYLNKGIGESGLKARDVAKVVLKCARKKDEKPIELKDAEFILKQLASGEREFVIINAVTGAVKPAREMLKYIRKVEYGADDLSILALDFRRANKYTSPRRNVCVMKYINNGKIERKAFISNSSSHSEERMIEYLKEQKISGDHVLRIFSEREPCVKTETNSKHNCTQKLTEYMPEVEVTYAFDYGTTKKEGDDARADLKKLLEERLK